MPFYRQEKLFARLGVDIGRATMANWAMRAAEAVQAGCPYPARANNCEPYSYLRHIFTHLPSARSLADYEALLPWNLDRAQIMLATVEGGRLDAYAEPVHSCQRLRLFFSPFRNISS